MARDQYEHVCAFALEHPWALTPSMLQIVAGILARRLAGGGPDAEAIGAALVSRVIAFRPARRSSGWPVGLPA